VKNAQLPQDRSAVVVDFLAGQTVIGVEGVYAAEWERNSPPCRRKTTPRAEVRTADHDFNKNGVVRYMSSLYVDFQVRKRLHQLLIEQTDSLSALVVFVPGLIVVPSGIAEGAQHTLEVMFVLKSNMLLYDRDAADTLFSGIDALATSTPPVEFRGPRRRGLK
jgi:hypothetical protein